MIYVNKWDFKTHKYKKVEKPYGNCKTYSNDMDEIVNCISCGKLIKFGETFTSRQWHTNIGFGYGVCELCYQKEWELERKYKNVVE